MYLTLTIRLATLDFRYSDNYRSKLKVSDYWTKKPKFLTKKLVFYAYWVEKGQFLTTLGTVCVHLKKGRTWIQGKQYSGSRSDQKVSDPQLS